MTSDVKHLLVRLLASLYLFFGGVSPQILCPVFKADGRFFHCAVLSCKCSFYALDYRSLIRYMICKVFYPVSCCFIFLLVLFGAQNLTF